MSKAKKQPSAPAPTLFEAEVKAVQKLDNRKSTKKNKVVVDYTNVGLGSIEDFGNYIANQRSNQTPKK